MKKPVEPRTIGKINITDALKNVEVLLEQEKSISPQVRAMMDLLVVVIHLLLGKLGLHSANSSIPPSQDPHRKRGSKRKGKGKKRKPGGQKWTRRVDSPTMNRIPIGSKPSKSTGCTISRGDRIEAWVLPSARAPVIDDPKSRK